jgi:hypothetical protein
MLKIKTEFLRTNGLLIKLFVFALLLISCEKDDSYNDNLVIDFTIPQYIYAGQQIDLSVQPDGLDNAVWNIEASVISSDFEMFYTFDKPGNYKIELTVYKNRVPVGCKSKIVTVLSRDKIYISKNPFYAVKGFAANQNHFVLEGYFKNQTEEKIVYLVFDYKLNCVDTLDYNQLISSDLINAISINENSFKFDGNGTESNSSTELKSTYPGESSTNTVANNLISYSNGYVNYHQENELGFVIDYYNSDLTKLWTKYITDNSSSAAKYLFNLNEKLYYISFDSYSDALDIESFKNISLSYNKVNYPFNNGAGDKSVLFAMNNSALNKISLGLYSKAANTSYLFDIDADCNLSLSKSVSGNFQSKIQYTLVDGNIIAINGNKLCKYSGSWDLVNEKTMDTVDFGVCSLSCNLFLIFSNTIEGLRLSYVDKNLCDVSL